MKTMRFGIVKPNSEPGEVACAFSELGQGWQGPAANREDGQEAPEGLNQRHVEGVQAVGHEMARDQDHDGQREGHQQEHYHVFVEPDHGQAFRAGILAHLLVGNN